MQNDTATLEMVWQFLTEPNKFLPYQLIWNFKLACELIPSLQIEHDRQDYTELTPCPAFKYLQQIYSWSLKLLATKIS